MVSKKSKYIDVSDEAIIHAKLWVNLHVKK